MEHVIENSYEIEGQPLLNALLISVNASQDSFLVSDEVQK